MKLSDVYDALPDNSFLQMSCSSTQTFRATDYPEGQGKYGILTIKKATQNRNSIEFAESTSVGEFNLWVNSFSTSGNTTLMGWKKLAIFDGFLDLFDE